MSVRLSEDEAWAEVAAAHTGIFTSMRADGTPISLPVWFVVLDRRIYVSGPSMAKRLARIGRNPRCAFLVEAGTRWDELRAVHFTGNARIVEDAESVLPILRALDEKYNSFRTKRATMPTATRKHYSAPTACIEIVPDDRILSWDNARLNVEAAPDA